MLSALPVLVLCGCGLSAAGRGPAVGQLDPNVQTISAEELRASSVHLLDAMRGRFRGMIVREDGEACPRITFRGVRSLKGENSPAVYVDGARAADTCILTTLSTRDVERIEAYSSGIAPRPPYQAHPNGLILVFLQRAST